VYNNFNANCDQNTICKNWLSLSTGVVKISQPIKWFLSIRPLRYRYQISYAFTPLVFTTFNSENCLLLPPSKQKNSLEKPIEAHLIKSSRAFLERGRSLPRPQQPNNNPCPEPDESSPYPHSLVMYDEFWYHAQILLSVCKLYGERSVVFPLPASFQRKCPTPMRCSISSCQNKYWIMNLVTCSVS
jgi:hypothetical protein